MTNPCACTQLVCSGSSFACTHCTYDTHHTRCTAHIHIMKEKTNYVRFRSNATVAKRLQQKLTEEWRDNAEDVGEGGGEIARTGNERVS